ncbi:MAG: ATP-dependent helicase HrpB [Planctomycetes bacterium]|nr:ATP-dependent helicase HrpB [Planctomycetota bacterium]
MQPLPIDPEVPRIVDLVRRHGALVLCAPPGSGKTTRVPPALLEGLGARGRVVVLQPRRIAARAAAARIASERGWTLGREVGYQVRFERRTSRETRLEIVTEGILTRRLQSDPFLEGVSCVVLDELHERSIHADLALAVLREVRAAARRDLVVVVMSATLDPEPVSRFLGGCPAVTPGARPLPGEVRYLDRPDRSPAGELAARVLRDAWRAARGNALVFLPGIDEIRRAARELEGFARIQDALIAPLHGGLSLEEQELALRPAARRKIVLATNVAETSLTIEGVDLVIDGGLARILRSDPRTGIDRLEVSRISKRSAEQRAGRAGRLGPGTAVRLWTRAEDALLPEAEAPEVRRVDLSATVLELKAWGVTDPASFGWFEAPEPAALERAEELLAALGAVEERRGPLTPAGRAMLAIPAHPRLSRMLVEAHARGVLAEGAALAALIEERDIVPLIAAGRPGGGGASETGPSDLLARLDLLDEAERLGRGGGGRGRLAALGVDPGAVRAVLQARDALLRSARETLGPEPRPAGRGSGGDAALLRVLLHGYPDRVVRRRAKGGDRGRMTGGRGVALARESIVRDAELFLAVEVEDGPRGSQEALVRLASAVRRDWLEEDFPQAISEARETFFDAKLERVRSTAAALYRDLPLEEPRDHRPEPAEAERVLAAAARERAEEAFAADEDASRWLARVRSLREWMPELGLPAFSLEELREAIAQACAGKSSLAEVRALGLVEVLRGRLDRAQLQALDRHAPEALRVPSGSAVRLAYEPGRPPVLAVRLQEMFGLAETPRVAAGRVPVLLHLLGPNFRPVQVTQDLRSFWDNTYAQVRKDLRARYPKHAWPEDPWTAAPQRKPGARR